MKIFKRRCTCFSSLVVRFRRRLTRSANSKNNLWFGTISIAWFDKSSIVVARYRLKRSSSNHSIFVRQSSVGTIIFAVYVEEIIKALFSWKLIWVLIFIWKTLVTRDIFEGSRLFALQKIFLCLEENTLLIC